MRKLLISASLVAAAMAATPAAAQYDSRGYDYRGGQNIERQLGNIADRIQRAEQRDRISQREARRLFRQVDQIDRLYDRYRRNGINPGEHRDLQNRIQYLRQQLRWERQEDRRDRWDDRNDRRDRWDDRDDRRDRRHDRDDDRWDD